MKNNFEFKGFDVLYLVFTWPYIDISKVHIKLHPRSIYTLIRLIKTCIALTRGLYWLMINLQTNLWWKKLCISFILGRSELQSSWWYSNQVWRGVCDVGKCCMCVRQRPMGRTGGLVQMKGHHTVVVSESYVIK